MKTAIIDDEKPAVRLLSNMISKLRPDWEIIQIPGSVEAATDWFANNPHPDIIFLDIQLSDGNSFIFVEQAKPSSIIIFTTSYDEYAVRAFSVNSIDYLLKPIAPDRLLAAIEKYEHLSKGQTDVQNFNILETLKSISTGDKKYRTRFLINGYERMTTLQVADISYFYSMNKITFAVTRDNQEHIIDLSLDKLIEQLNPDEFFRTNRQTIVNINAIVKIEPYFQGKIIVYTKPSSKEKIVVSREKATSLKNWLNY